MRDPEKYKWEPAELLAQLARIYLHLSAADRSGVFTAAIAQDERSYHEGLFTDAAIVRLLVAKLPCCSGWSSSTLSLTAALCQSPTVTAKMGGCCGGGDDCPLSVL